MKVASKPRAYALHRILVSKKGGAHEKTEKAKRKKLKMDLAKAVKEAVIQSIDVLNNRFTYSKPLTALKCL